MSRLEKITVTSFLPADSLYCFLSLYTFGETGSHVGEAL